MSSKRDIEVAGQSAKKGIARAVIGSPSSWLLPFSSLYSAYRDAKTSLRLRLSVRLFLRLALTSFRSMRWSGFEWPGKLGFLFCAMSLFYAISGQWLNAAIMTASLIASCFLRVKKDG